MRHAHITSGIVSRMCPQPKARQDVRMRLQEQHCCLLEIGKQLFSNKLSHVSSCPPGQAAAGMQQYGTGQEPPREPGPFALAIGVWPRKPRR